METASAASGSRLPLSGSELARILVELQPSDAQWEQLQRTWPELRAWRNAFALAHDLRQSAFPDAPLSDEEFMRGWFTAHVPPPPASQCVDVHGVYVPVHTDARKAAAGKDVPHTFVTVPTAVANARRLAVALACSDAPILLEGPPGAGKTTTLRYVAGQLGFAGDMIELHLDDAMDGKTLIGMYTCGDTPGEFRWQPGVLTQAVQSGTWILIEDIDRAPFDVLASLSLLMKHRVLTLPGRDSIRAHDDFRLFGTRSTHPSSGAAGMRESAAPHGEPASPLHAVAEELTSTQDGEVHAPTTLTAHEPIIGPFASFAHSWLRVPIQPLSVATVQAAAMWADTDIGRVLQHQYSRVHPRLLASAVQAFAALQELGYSRTGALPAQLLALLGDTASAPGTFAALRRHARHISLRMLFQWGARLQHLQDQLLGSGQAAIGESGYISEGVRREAALHGCRLLADHASEAGTRAVVARCIAVCFGLDPQHTIDAAGSSRPEWRLDSHHVNVGTAVLSRTRPNPEATAWPSWFAPTRHSLRTMESVMHAVSLSEPVLLVGETGIGKTSAVQALASTCGVTLTAFNMNMQTESGDLMGGFKPVAVKQLAAPILEKFEHLFRRTFSEAANASFLASISSAAAAGHWSKVEKGLRRGCHMALTALGARESSGAATGDLATSALQNEWLALQASVGAFHRHVADGSEAAGSAGSAARKPNMTFAYVEGALLRAVREGGWVLLDEINLASADVLQRLVGLLDATTMRITVAERGDGEAITRHPDFRMFAAMNPSTDVGKRDLPPAVRHRFTEIFVEDVLDLDDLSTIISGYLAHVPFSPTEPRPVDALVKFYTAAKKMASPQVAALRDGSGRRPVYSLRTLARALTVAADFCAQGFPAVHALREGIHMCFFMQLDVKSADLLARALDDALPAVAGRSAQRGPSHAPGTVMVSQYRLRAGPQAPQDWADTSAPALSRFVLVPSAQRVLQLLARAVSCGRYPVLLQGPTSSGKTTVVEYLAALTGHKCIRINNHEHTDLAEYLGTYTTGADGTLAFVDGLLVNALRHGHWLILDELNLAPTEVLEALNRLLDDNRELFLPETQETIKPHPRFMLFATQNPAGLYGGRKELSLAFRNRFVEVNVDDIPEAELSTILTHRSQLPSSFVDAMVGVAAELHRIRQTSNVFAGRHGFITTRDLLRWAFRRPSTYDELAAQGYMLLAERLRTEAEKEVVAAVLRKHTRSEWQPQVAYEAAFSAADADDGMPAAAAGQKRAQSTVAGRAPEKRARMATTAGIGTEDTDARSDLDGARGWLACATSDAEGFHRACVERFHDVVDVEHGGAIREMTRRSAPRGTEGLSSVSITHALQRMFTLVVQCVAHNEAVLLVGDTGSGKTSVIQLLALLLGVPLHVVSCHASTETADFIGGYRPNRGRGAALERVRAALLDLARVLPPVVLDTAVSSYPGVLHRTHATVTQWRVDESLDATKVGAFLHHVKGAVMTGGFVESPVDSTAVTASIARAEACLPELTAVFHWYDGPLVEAMRAGHFFLMDECSLAEDAVLERLNSVLEPSRTLTIAERAATSEGADAQPVGNVVTAASSFRFFATMNPGGDFGKRELSPALRNRFTEIWVPALVGATDLRVVVHDKLAAVALASGPRNDPRHALLAPVAGAMSRFVSWFDVHASSGHLSLRVPAGDSPASGPPRQRILTVTMRDIEAWIRFVDACVSSRASVDPAAVWSAFLHGACLVLLDGLGLGSGLPMTSMQDIRAAAGQELLSYVPDRWREHISWIVSSADVAAGKLTFEAGPDRIGIAPFYVQRNTRDVVTTAPDVASRYAFAAPTTTVNAFKVLRAMQVSRPILLEGDPGVGKSSLVEALANAGGRELVRINLSEQTELSDLFGQDVPVAVTASTEPSAADEASSGARFAWVDGVFLRALKRGCWVLLDEINLASQAVLEGLNACFDHRGTVFIPEINQSFACPTTFRVFATQNPVGQGSGRKGLPKSFLNRFSKVYVQALGRDDYLCALRQHHPSLPAQLLEILVRYAGTLQNECSGRPPAGGTGAANGDPSTPAAHRAFSAGQPWEVNLRDLLRWADAIAQRYSQAGTSAASPRGPIAAAHALMAGFHSLFLARFRTLPDRIRALTLLVETCADSGLDIRAHAELHDYVHLGVSPGTVELDDVHVPRTLEFAPASSTPWVLTHRISRNMYHVGLGAARGIPMLLVGSSGSGRAACVRQLAHLAGRTLHELVVTPSTDATDILGSFEQLDLHRHLAQARARTAAVIRRAMFASLNVGDGSTSCTAVMHSRALSAALESVRALQTTEPQAAASVVLSALRVVRERADLGPTANIKELEAVERDVLQLTALLPGGTRGAFEWVDGPLVKAAELGEWLLVHNVNFCTPAVVDRLNAVLEPGGTLLVSECGLGPNGEPRRITPHPNFRVFMTMDHSNGEVSRALRNRCVEVFIGGEELLVHKDVIRALGARLPGDGQSAAGPHDDEHTALARSDMMALLASTRIHTDLRGACLRVCDECRVDGFDADTTAFALARACTRSLSAQTPGILHTFASMLRGSRSMSRKSRPHGEVSDQLAVALHAPLMGDSTVTSALQLVRALLGMMRGLSQQDQDAKLEGVIAAAWHILRSRVLALTPHVSILVATGIRMRATLVPAAAAMAPQVLRVLDGFAARDVAALSLDLMPAKHTYHPDFWRLTQQARADRIFSHVVQAGTHVTVPAYIVALARVGAGVVMRDGANVLALDDGNYLAPRIRDLCGRFRVSDAQLPGRSVVPLVAFVLAAQRALLQHVQWSSLRDSGIDAHAVQPVLDSFDSLAAITHALAASTIRCEAMLTSGQAGAGPATSAASMLLPGPRADMATSDYEACAQVAFRSACKALGRAVQCGALHEHAVHALVSHIAEVMLMAGVDTTWAAGNPLVGAQTPSDRVAIANLLAQPKDVLLRPDSVPRAPVFERAHAVQLDLRALLQERGCVRPRDSLLALRTLFVLRSPRFSREDLPAAAQALASLRASLPADGADPGFIRSASCHGLEVERHMHLIALELMLCLRLLCVHSWAALGSDGRQWCAALDALPVPHLDVFRRAHDACTTVADKLYSSVALALCAGACDAADIEPAYAVARLCDAARTTLASELRTEASASVSKQPARHRGIAGARTLTQLATTGYGLWREMAAAWHRRVARTTTLHGQVGNDAEGNNSLSRAEQHLRTLVRGIGHASRWWRAAEEGSADTQASVLGLPIQQGLLRVQALMVMAELCRTLCPEDASKARSAMLTWVWRPSSPLNAAPLHALSASRDARVRALAVPLLASFDSLWHTTESRSAGAFAVDQSLAAVHFHALRWSLTLPIMPIDASTLASLRFVCASDTLDTSAVRWIALSTAESAVSGLQSLRTPVLLDAAASDSLADLLATTRDQDMASALTCTVRRGAFVHKAAAKRTERTTLDGEPARLRFAALCNKLAAATSNLLNSHKLADVEAWSVPQRESWALAVSQAVNDWWTNFADFRDVVAPLAEAALSIVHAAEKMAGSSDAARSSRVFPALQTNDLQTMCTLARDTRDADSLLEMVCAFTVRSQEPVSASHLIKSALSAARRLVLSMEGAAGSLLDETGAGAVAGKHVAPIAPGSDDEFHRLFPFHGQLAAGDACPQDRVAPSISAPSAASLRPTTVSPPRNDSAFNIATAAAALASIEPGSQLQHFLPPAEADAWLACLLRAIDDAQRITAPASPNSGGCMEVLSGLGTIATVIAAPVEVDDSIKSMSGLADELATSCNLGTGARRPYDFFRDANAGEASLVVVPMRELRARLDALLVMFPENAVLQMIRGLVDGVLAQPITTPIPSLLMGVMNVLTKVDEWQAVAASHVSLSEHAKALTDVVLRWRRLELASWRLTLLLVADDVQRDAALVWSKLMAAVAALIGGGTDAPPAVAGDGPPTVRAEGNGIEAWFSAIEKFVRACPLGQFAVRLRLLRTTAATMHAHPVHASIMLRVADFYDQYVPAVTRSAAVLLTPALRELQDQVRLHRWDEQSFAAMRESTEKGHRILHKFMVKVRELLGHSIDSIVDKVYTAALPGMDAPAAADETVVAATRTFHSTLRSRAVPVEDVGPMPTEAARHLRRAVSLLANDAPLVSASVAKQVGAACAAMRDAMEAYDAYDAELSHADTLRMRREKVLVELLRNCKEAGLSWRRADISTEVLGNVQTLLSVVPAKRCAFSDVIVPSTAAATAEGSVTRIHAIVDRVLRIRRLRVTAGVHADLSPSQQQRLEGYADFCLSTSIAHVKGLTVAMRHATALEALSTALRQHALFARIQDGDGDRPLEVVRSMRTLQERMDSALAVLHFTRASLSRARHLLRATDMVLAGHAGRDDGDAWISDAVTIGLVPNLETADAAWTSQLRMLAQHPGVLQRVQGALASVTEAISFGVTAQARASRVLSAAVAAEQAVTSVCPVIGIGTWMLLADPAEAAAARAQLQSGLDDMNGALKPVLTALRDDDGVLSSFIGTLLHRCVAAVSESDASMVADDLLTALDTAEDDVTDAVLETEAMLVVQGVVRASLEPEGTQHAAAGEGADPTVTTTFGRLSHNLDAAWANARFPSLVKCVIQRLLGVVEGGPAIGPAVCTMVQLCADVAQLAGEQHSIAAEHATAHSLRFSQLVLTLFEKGLRVPTPPEEESAGDKSNPSGGEASGTGMGEGTGSKDVSDQITNEEQVLGTRDQEEEAGKGEEDHRPQPGEDDGIEMTGDFDGSVHTLDDDGASQDERKSQSGGEDAEEELDRQMGQVDADDPNANQLDERLWNAEDEEARSTASGMDDRGDASQEPRAEPEQNAEDAPDQTAGPKELSGQDARGPKGAADDELAASNMPEDEAAASEMSDTAAPEDRHDEAALQSDHDTAEPDGSRDDVPAPSDIDMDDAEDVDAASNADTADAEQDAGTAEADGTEQDDDNQQDAKHSLGEQISSDEDMPDAESLPDLHDERDRTADATDAADGREEKMQDMTAEMREQQQASDDQGGPDAAARTSTRESKAQQSRQRSTASRPSQPSNRATANAAPRANASTDPQDNSQKTERADAQLEDDGKHATPSPDVLGDEGAPAADMRDEADAGGGDGIDIAADMQQLRRQLLERELASAMRDGRPEDMMDMDAAPDVDDIHAAASASNVIEHETEGIAALLPTAAEPRTDQADAHTALAERIAAASARSSHDPADKPRNDVEETQAGGYDGDAMELDEEQALPPWEQSAAREPDQHDAAGDTVAMTNEQAWRDDVAAGMLEDELELTHERDPETLEAIRKHFREELQQAIDSEREEVRRAAADMAWATVVSLTTEASLRLCESLRLVLEPTLCAKLGGEYRTGKRINMRRVIAYIASNFRKDKIWMRRSLPSKRTYQVMLAIDDSRSMAAENTGAGAWACEAMVMMSKALSRLEVGQLGVAAFGETVSVLHPLHEPFTDAAGAAALSRFTFKQETTRTAHAVDTLVRTLSEAAAAQSASSSHASCYQLLFLISDGVVGAGPEREAIRRFVAAALERRQLIVMLVLDRRGSSNNDSIMNMQSIRFEGGRVVRSHYMDDFPFPFYVYVRDVAALPDALADALRQWFEIMARQQGGDV